MVKSAAPAEELAEFVGFLRRHPRRVVLSGAGCSTESGIPDYRGPDGAWRHPRPIQFGEFIRDESRRRHYWARAFRGWARFSAAAPNAAHRALARLERASAIDGVLTQNVDGLHHVAGSRRVVELHGSNHRVICLGCGERSSRADMQERMRVANPGWEPGTPEMRADGDAALDPRETETFRVPACAACGGMLKPDLVFFGESVPRARVEDAMAQVLGADVLVVVGSSLAVWSGFRFARAAAESGIPVALLNLGWTRADEIASIKIELPCGAALPAVAEALDGDRGDA